MTARGEKRGKRGKRRERRGASDRRRRSRRGLWERDGERPYPETDREEGPDGEDSFLVRVPEEVPPRALPGHDPWRKTEGNLGGRAMKERPRTVLDRYWGETEELRCPRREEGEEGGEDEEEIRGDMSRNLMARLQSREAERERSRVGPPEVG
ncbi:hypothetical protein Tco_0699611 [Tanacetum coccineum]